MAERPVFTVCSNRPYYGMFYTQFAWARGFAGNQKQMNIASIHRGYLELYPDHKVLEISGRSTEPWGAAARAISLKKYLPSRGISLPVENVFQGGKVFSGGGPYRDLLDVPPLQAKRDERLETSGELIAYEFEGVRYPVKPKNVFYDFIYVNALIENPEIAEKLEAYDGFTDIDFSPDRSVDCPARAAAIYVSLVRSGRIGSAKNFDDFYSLFVVPKPDENKPPKPVEILQDCKATQETEAIAC